MNQHRHNKEHIIDVIKTYHPKGYFDREMADIYKYLHGRRIQRNTISKRRRALGLKGNRDTPQGNKRFRELRSKLHREALERMGEESLTDIRDISRRCRALEHYGWVEAENEREARVLSLLSDHPAGLNRGEIASRLGYKVSGITTGKKNSAIDKSIYSLVNRGVVCKSRKRVLVKRVFGQGKGRSQSRTHYLIAPGVQRKHGIRKELDSFGNEVA